MKKIIHLDCTLRDGGYYTNWNFDRQLVNDYLNALDKIHVDFVELGFRFLDKKKTKGEFAYTSEKLINELKIPKNLNLGVMINASDFIDKKESPVDLIKKNFIHKKKSKILLVRIACHFEELKKISNIVKFLKKNQYKVGINVMQISDRSTSEIQTAVKLINKLKPNVLYFADSLGSMDKLKTKKIINIIKSGWKGEVGIHTHDNLGKALENSLEAVNQGIRWVDTTVTGMGRGPGNTKTEIAILEFKNFKKKNINLDPLLSLINKWFSPLQKKYEWGSNLYYYLAGKKGVHPTFVQEMLGDPTFSPKTILSNINYLGRIGGKKFAKDLISSKEDIYRTKDVGEWSPYKHINGRDVLLLGPGDQLKENYKKVSQFIKKNKPYVISINFEDYIPSKFINARIACHILRVLSNLREYKDYSIPLILPLNKIKKFLSGKINKFKMYNYGIQVKKNIFKFENNNAILPNSLAISYALAVCNSGKCKKIFIAGFDGYDKSNPKKNNVDETIDLYKSTKGTAKIISLTPTLYDVSKSISFRK